MKVSYPHFTIGTTLVLSDCDGETRRVYVRPRGALVEIGEITSGPLTQGVYGSPAHLHCVHLRGKDEQSRAAAFFAHDEPFLIDYMDELDASGVAYGYLNSVVGQCVSYRPAR